MPTDALPRCKPHTSFLRNRFLFVFLEDRICCWDVLNSFRARIINFLSLFFNKIGSSITVWSIYVSNIWIILSLFTFQVKINLGIFYFLGWQNLRFLLISWLGLIRFVIFSIVGNGNQINYFYLVKKVLRNWIYPSLVLLYNFRPWFWSGIIIFFIGDSKILFLFWLTLPLRPCITFVHLFSKPLKCP